MKHEKKSSQSKKIIKAFYSCRKLKVFVIDLLMILSCLFEIAISWVVKYAINSISEGNSKSSFFFSILIAFCVIAAATIMTFIMSLLKNKFIENFSTFFKNKMFDELMVKDVVEFEKKSTGEYVSIFQTDFQRIVTYYIENRWEMIKTFSICFFGIVSMLLMSIKLSIVVICIQSIPVIISLILGKKLVQLERVSAEARGKLSAETQEYLKGFRVIKSFSSESVFINKYKILNCNSESANKKLENKKAVISTINVMMSYLMIISLFFIGGLETINGRMQIGTVIACFQLLLEITTPISVVTQLFNMRRNANAIFDRIDNYFFKESTSLSKINNIKEISAINSIELVNVSFSYEKDKTALNDINICINPGEKVAIVGNSGSGKSTMMKLILGFYDNYTGQILFNGVELHEISTEQITQNISIVQQEVFVFNDTVISNIAMGVEFEQKDINDAIEKAGLSGFMEAHGEDYVCGEDGKNLSGGEKQRISIARALLRNSGVILFDEATAALDKHTTFEIENTINQLEKTCVVITHKLDQDILSNYDKVIVFKDGKIVECGKVAELLKKKGEFYLLYNS